MNITTKEVRGVVSILDDIIKEYKEESSEKKRDWRTYEQQATKRLRKAFRELKPLVHEAVSSIKIVRGETKGAKPKLTLEQKVLAILLQRLVGKSNREMENMTVLFLWLTDMDVSYKTIERLYSDHEVQIALHNLHILILKEKEIKSADTAGDGTGYALSVKKHYATEAQKLKDKIKTQNTNKKSKKRKRETFIYSFVIMDINTRMYLASGTSFKSEKEAYEQAIRMLRDIDITITSIRLDRYFSAQEYVKQLHEQFCEAKLYLIPKKNATIKGSWEWKRTLHRFVKDTKQYLHEYYHRNQSESGFAEDKRRTGWKIAQKRPERVDTADRITKLWHNLYWLGGS